MRASLHFATGGGALALGLQEEGTHRVVDVLSCLQLSERMNRAARALRDALRREPGARAAAARPRPPGVARRGNAPGLARDDPRSPTRRAPWPPSPTRVPGLDGFGVARARGSSGCTGAPFVEASVLGVVAAARVRGRSSRRTVSCSSPSRARSWTWCRPGTGAVLDLYAGVGLFALPLAARGERDVLAVEWSSSAAEDARWAARRNGLEPVRVVTGDVAKALAEAGPGKGERIVLDPPRTGAGPEVVALVADRAPEAIVYVSCDPPTLGRDLAAFAARGYRPDVVHLFDLFPDTFHMETVVRLRPA